MSGGRWEWHAPRQEVTPMFLPSKVGFGLASTCPMSARPPLSLLQSPAKGESMGNAAQMRPYVNFENFGRFRPRAPCELRELRSL